MRRLLQLIREELYGFQPRLMLVRLLVSLLPEHTCSRLRAIMLRRAGFKIGRGTLFAGMPSMTGSGDLRQRLSFGSLCWVNTGLQLDLGATIAICDHVVIGPEVMLISSTHEYGSPQHRAGGLAVAPITLEDGVWLGARCMILPGVTVGQGAVVAAGAVVTRDVPPNALVGGVPARVLRELPSDDREMANDVVEHLGDPFRLVQPAPDEPGSPANVAPASAGPEREVSQGAPDAVPQAAEN
jgi:maltose O-acetyltransferase